MKNIKKANYSLKKKKNRLFVVDLKYLMIILIIDKCEFEKKKFL